MRLVFINRQGKIVVPTLPKEDADACQAILDAYNYDDVLQYCKTVDGMNITKSLVALNGKSKSNYGFREGEYLNFVNEIYPGVFKVLEHALYKLVKPHIPEQLYTYLTNDWLAHVCSVIKPNKKQVGELKHRFGFYRDIEYIRQIRPLEGDKVFLTVRDYDGKELDQIEVKDGDLLLIDKGVRKSGDILNDFGILGYGEITNVGSIEKISVFKGGPEDTEDEIEAILEWRYNGIKEIVRRQNAGEPPLPTWEEKLIQQHEEVIETVRKAIK
nr:MAG TPA: hypothetical protein [Caudoviricetes sp.]